MSYRPWKILGVDNGTTQLGLSTLEYDVDRDIARVVDMHTLAPGNRAYSRYARTLERRGPGAARRQWIQEEFRTYLLEVDPDVVCIETPFIGSSKTQSSFGPLTISLEGLIDVVLSIEDVVEHIVEIERVAPHEAKRAVTPPNAEYNSDKEMIKPNVLIHPGIDTGHWDLDRQSLDAIDAIAIGYTAIVRLARF